MDQHNKPNALYSMRKTPIQDRSKATIDAILSAATRILLTIGYDKASTNKIAELAGVGIGSLYEYFPGKEAIYAEVRRREDQRLFDLTMNRAEPETLQELIRSHVSIYLEFVRSNLDLHAALINDVPQFAVGQEELPFYREYLPWAKSFLEAHKAELRQTTNILQVSSFITRATRATIDNYVLHAPEQLNDPLIESLLIDLLERFL
ncbi:MAG: TetR/AcrR family transcriptional regulator, partial [Pseudomonadota bacterium]